MIYKIIIISLIFALLIVNTFLISKYRKNKKELAKTQFSYQVAKKTLDLIEETNKNTKFLFDEKKAFIIINISKWAQSFNYQIDINKLDSLIENLSEMIKSLNNQSWDLTWKHYYQPDYNYLSNHKNKSQRRKFKYEKF